MLRKANQSPQNEVGLKINIKQETKDFGAGTCALGRIREGGKVSKLSGTLSQAEMGKLQNFRGEEAETVV